VKIHFGDLPDDARQLMTSAMNIDFMMWPMKAPRWFSAWTRDERGLVAGIFSIEFKYAWEGYVNVVVMDQRCMTRRALRAIFTAAFSQATRLTAEVEPHNHKALRQVQRMGFVYEGYRRMGLEGTRDVLCYGMLKGDCKYLPGYTGPTVLASPTLPAATYERVH
jgi:RimJ/RimL family protein N-acetyltransferase